MRTITIPVPTIHGVATTLHVRPHQLAWDERADRLLTPSDLRDRAWRHYCNAATGDGNPEWIANQRAQQAAYEVMADLLESQATTPKRMPMCRDCVESVGGEGAEPGIGARWADDGEACEASHHIPRVQPHPMWDDCDYFVDTALSMDGVFIPTKGDLVVEIMSPLGDYPLVLVSARYTVAETHEAAVLAVDAWLERDAEASDAVHYPRSGVGGPLVHVTVHGAERVDVVVRYDDGGWTVEIPLCPDCVDRIGGACAGPDVPWRPAHDGESCEAEDCEAVD